MDRIKYWNIVPGDTIADRNDPSKQLREVLGINKLSNKVFLKKAGDVCVVFVMPIVSNHDCLLFSNQSL